MPALVAGPTTMIMMMLIMLAQIMIVIDKEGVKVMMISVTPQ
jgi:hypothetical protein